MTPQEEAIAKAEQEAALAEELRKQQSLREYDARRGTNVPVNVGAAPTGVDYNQGARQALEAAQDEARQKREIEGEKSSSLQRFVNEPVQEVLRATPGVNYLVPGYSPSSATPYADNKGAVSSGADTVSSNVPANASAQPQQKSPEEMQLDALLAQAQRPVQVPTLSMNKNVREGILAQQEALRGVLPVAEEQEGVKEAARAGQQATGQSYIDKLRILQGQQSGLFNQRRAEMDREAAQTRAAENAFDSMRLSRQLGQNTVSTGAMSFAAGLVGALKGAAGDMSPNQVMSEVDKAVERDVTNQREQYERMKYGQSVSRSNYLDARQMGVDEQQALATATVASMDQYKRALEFAEQRVTDAKTKAALKDGIGKLQEHMGGIEMNLAARNAANWIAANRQRADTIMQLMQARQALRGLDPKTAGEAMNHYQGVIGSGPFVEAKGKLDAVASVVKEFKNADPRLLEQAITPDFKNTLIRGLEQAAANNKGSAVFEAFDTYMAQNLKGTNDPAVNAIRARIQKLVNANMKFNSGGSVTNGEQVRNVLETDFSSPAGVRRWFDGQKNDALAGISPYRNFGATSFGPTGKAVQSGLDLLLLPSISDIEGDSKMSMKTQRLASTTE